MFGPENLDANLIPAAAESQDCGLAKRLGEKLVSAVRKHANGHPQNDDIAVVSFGRLEVGEPPITRISR
jgi:hypothetical protein